MPATGHKNPDTCVVTGYELAGRMSICQSVAWECTSIVTPANTSFGLRKSTRGWLSQSPALSKGKKQYHMDIICISLIFVKVRYLINLQTHTYKMTQTVIVFSI